jgi:hypothetical protein
MIEKRAAPAVATTSGITTTMHDRTAAALRGEAPERPPFIGRLELWHRSHCRAGTLPPDFDGLSLTDVHRAVGMGQLKFVIPYGLKLRGVEVAASRDGVTFYREAEPVIDSFPGMWDLVATDRAGVTVTELLTPAGKLTVRHEVLEETLRSGADPYLKEHLIKDEADYAAVEYILERAEFVPRYERLAEMEGALGEIGYAVPLLHRIPFQQVLLEYLGEAPTFYALHDAPGRVERLLGLLDEQMLEILRRLRDLPAAYVEFPDNLHGAMTNPKLFARYCLPHYQRYTAAVHAQAKRAGSHTDGDLKPLLRLLSESGLDVCESFSPAPLTPCTFEEAWAAWQAGPMIWGGIPSPLLEARTDEAVFEEYLERVLRLVWGHPVLLNVADMVMGINLIERVRYIAHRVETFMPAEEGKPRGH